MDVNFDVHENDKEIYGEYKTKPEVLHAETNAIAKVVDQMKVLYRFYPLLHTRTMFRL